MQHFGGRFLLRGVQKQTIRRFAPLVSTHFICQPQRSFKTSQALFDKNEHVHPRRRAAIAKEQQAAAERAKAEGGDASGTTTITNGYMLAHPIWSEEELNSVEIHHRKCQSILDYVAYGTVQFLRFNFDLFSGYYFGQMNEGKWLTRFVFLETVAGVPGMVAAMVRHLHSLRRMKRDHGWIHTLLEEAENERMHLLTAMNLMKPGYLFRAGVIFAQCVYVPFFSLAYFLSPYFCHRVVGYLEEEAVKTYTLCLEQLDSGGLPMWAALDAPPIAMDYWQLREGSKMKDVILAIRADEGHHRDVNHSFAETGTDSPNPWGPGR